MLVDVCTGMNDLCGGEEMMTSTHLDKAGSGSGIGGISSEFVLVLFTTERNTKRRQHSNGRENVQLVLVPSALLLLFVVCVLPVAYLFNINIARLIVSFLSLSSLRSSRPPIIRVYVVLLPVCL